MAGESGGEIVRRRPAGQVVEMERHADQHALAKIADRGNEDRPPGKPAIGFDFRQVLMFEAERVEFEIRRHAAFIGFDHRLAAAAIARDGIDRDRKIRRDQPRIDERTQQRDRAGRIAAGIGDAAGGGDLLLLACGEFGKAIDPAGGDAMGARCVEKARARLAHRRDERRRFLCRFVRQAEDGEIDLGEERALGLRIFARLRCDARPVSMPAMPASRARMPSPVVPASPSMKILAAIAASLRFAASVRCRSRCQGAFRHGSQASARSARPRALPPRQNLHVALNQRRRGKGGDIGVVIGRRDFDDVHPAPVDVGERPQRGERLGRTQTAGHRRPGAGCEGRVERVDVEAEIGRPRPDPRLDARGDAARAECEAGIDVEDFDAAIARRHGANADLDRPAGIDEPLGHGARHESAVRHFRAVVVPGVLMGIELHEGERPMGRRMGAQQRQGDEMIAAERHQMDARFDDLAGLRLDRRRGLREPLIFEETIAAIDHCERFERIAPGGILRIAVEGRRRPSDRRRSEPRPRPVRGRAVERHAPDRNLGLGEVLAVAPPHERRHSGEGRFIRPSLERPRHGIVDGGAVDRHRPPTPIAPWRRDRCAAKAAPAPPS